jgi:Zn-dependent protease
MEELSVFQRVAVWAIPVLFAITVHEVAHGFVALRLGDPTAKMLGRLTLNPIKHIDPLGTVVLPLLMLMMGGFIFGWAKPVPVTWENLRHPKRDMALVAAAGPISNLLMALFWALLMRTAISMDPEPGSPLVFLLYVSLAGIQINIVLALLNMLPIPPLDGGRVAVGLLPGRLSWQLSQLEPFGLIIILVLLATKVLNVILQWPLAFFIDLFYGLGGLH